MKQKLIHSIESQFEVGIPLHCRRNSQKPKIEQEL